MQNPSLVRSGLAATPGNDNVIIIEITNNAEAYGTWTLGSAAGVMDVFVSGDGSTFQSAAVAMEDLGATAPATRVVVTTAGGNYLIRGRWRGIRVMQNGATGVTGAYLIGADG